jgi:hypothetical protein
MARAKKTITIPEQKIINKIYWIRGKKVMLDFDLSEMYGIEAKVANQDGRIEKHEEKILAIFVALKKLLNPPPAPRRKIGFRRSDEKDQ